MTPPVRFREVQHFHPAAVGLAAALGVVVLTGVFAAALSAGAPPQSPGVIAGAAIAVFAFALLAVLKVVTEVDDEGIRVRLSPLPFKHIPFGDVKAAAVRTYRPLLEYGGWGLRYTLSHGWAYNARGNRGVQLELHNGKRILIGSQEPEELLRAIRERVPVEV